MDGTPSNGREATSAAPQSERKDAPPARPAPSTERVVRAVERGQRDAVVFLHDQAPSLDVVSAWLVGVAQIFGQRLLPLLRSPQPPVKASIDLRLPWRSRWRLLVSGRLSVAAGFALRAAEPVEVLQVFMQLQSAGRRLDVRVVEPDAPAAPATKPAPADTALPPGTIQPGKPWPRGEENHSPAAPDPAGAQHLAGDTTRRGLCVGATSRTAWRRRDDHLKEHGALDAPPVDGGGR